MLLVGDLVHCPSLGELQILRHHLIVVDPQGRISYIAPAQLLESAKVIEAASEPVTPLPRGSFLVPSFCDLHLHAPQFLYQGTGLHLPLMEWLDAYAYKAEEILDADPALAERVYKRLAVRLIESGTGSVLFFGTIKSETNLILARVMQAAGVRAFVGKLSMDISSRPTYVEKSAEDSLSAARRFIDDCYSQVAHLPAHERLIQPVITPRFIPTCSDKLLSGLGALAAERSVTVQSHMAESHDEVGWVKQERKQDDIDIFEEAGLLTTRTVQAHCTFLDSPSLERMQKSGAAVAHCPLSNSYFSQESFRLREALQRGVKVGLGTDIAGGYSIDIMNSMRQAVIVSRMREGTRLLASGSAEEDQEAMPVSIDWKESLYLATRGGAHALGLSGGVFSIGASFDAQCIHIRDLTTGQGIGALDFFDDAPQIADEWDIDEEVIEKWWSLGDGRNRYAMWVQGREVTRRD
ncbi:Metallo-dependent hydrolase [Obba rivulosa]|uniref:Metallo-dependent hydrolase n=1 Tax=Obba rivulosa TaxID=1052685 RepID=A0A8E2AJ97_9APHY|nr:Metallo-dependent hydrolase [Obba rivulosa]